MADPALAEHVAPPSYLAALHHRWLAGDGGPPWRDAPGTLLFFDISGFTPLTERLMTRGKIGAEELTEILGEVFGELLGAAGRFGGDTLKFGGDAVLILFDGDDHEQRACAAAWEMQRTMRRYRRLKTSAGNVALGASCGVASGPVHVFLAGSEFRELIVAGPTTTSTLAMESAAHAGEILVAPSTAAALHDGLLGGPTSGGGRPLLGPPEAPEAEVRRPRESPRTPGVQPALAPYLLHDADGEHRQATIAFVQFRGIDELLAVEGPGGLQVALDGFIDTVQAACTKHQVTFITSDCDGNAGKVMLATGAPASGSADEDRMLFALREIVTHVSSLQVRAGTNRGRVFAVDLGAPERRTWTTMGETTNLAARVMGKAGNGTALATRALLDRVVTPMALEWLEPFHVKGVAEAVEGAIVGGVLEERAPDDTTTARSAGDLPFVGREAVLDELESLVRAASGVTVEVRGAPGIGKSRLLAELAERTMRIGRRVVVVEGRPYGTDTAYGAVRPPLRSLLAEPPRTDDLVERALVDRLPPTSRPWMGLVGIPFGLDLPPTAELLALSPNAARVRLRIELLPVLADIVPDGALLLIENAHWLDEASASLLAAVVSVPGGSRLTTVIATRELVPDLQPDGMRTIELGPLDDDAVEQLLTRDDGEHRPLPPAVARTVAARAHGHPLFLQELVAAARAGRDVDALPDTVEALLVAHIDRLAPADRAVLREAAVLGMGFDLPTLQAISGLDSEHLAATLQRLDEFLVEDADGQWTFRQSLARETAYEALPFRVRRRLHGRAAELLEVAAGDDPGSISPILSLHADAANDAPRSWRFSRMAADRAERQGAPIEQAVFLRRQLRAGRQMHELTPAAICEVAQRLGDVCELAGLYEQAEQAYQESRRLVVDDPARIAELCRRQGWLRERTGSYSQALAWYTRGLSALGNTGGMTSTRLRGRLTLAYGAARLRQGRLADSIDPLERAAQLAANTDDRASRAHAAYLLDWALTDLGRAEEAGEHRARALQIYEELGDWTGQANVLNNLGVDAFFEGDWEGAKAFYERSRKARERGGDVVRYGEALVNIGELLVDQGRLTEAEPRLRRALSLWRGAGFPVGIGVALMNLGRAAARVGDDERAEEFLTRARETLEAIGSEQTVDVAVREGERIVLRGRGRAALPGLEAARTETVRRGSAPVLLAQIDRLRAAATAQEGDVQEAMALLDASLEAAHGTPYEEALTVDLRARLAPLAGEPVDEQSWEDALGVLRRLGVVRIWPPPVDGAPHSDEGVAIGGTT
ncbi:MAG: tetratricopeptide repeat protein [Solirubrobacteraceae bacterium]|nr:tetratricopeptide repeat protein [Solirubrobacteraceae bacterium]